MTEADNPEADNREWQRLKVVVTGATGNVGASTIEALAEHDEVEEIVGLTRRAPAWEPAKTRWVSGDIVSSELEPVFAGADVVIHLAWAIQPAHDPEALKRANVEGSRRVFDAVATAGVPKLVYSSSVGAYSPGPKDRLVSEDWPLGGLESSSYSRHKAAVERLLDEFEERESRPTVVRLRPALIFKDEEATDIRSLFAGPLLPSFLPRSKLLPAIPRLSGLCFQTVHSSDVGRAFALATVRDVEGPFNLAAAPALDGDDLAALLDARTFPLPASVVRRLADLSGRLRLQPALAGWLDIALGVPLISAERATRELDWEPWVTATDAVAELLEAMRGGASEAALPLKSRSPGARPDELRGGVGSEPWTPSAEQKLIEHLADVHSIEEQALVQMRAAPAIAGDSRLAKLFEDHLIETESQERRVRERLLAHGADPSRRKDRGGKASGIGMLVFAESQPDSPGKLTAHAFSYEHMEIAAYALLRQSAQQAGDRATSALADKIAEEEEQMAERLEGCFDVSVEASRNGSGPAGLDRELDRYLGDAQAIEKQGQQLLEMALRSEVDEELRELFAKHLEESEGHLKLLEERLEVRGVAASKAKDATLRIGGLQVGASFAAQPDTAAKLAGFAFAFEHLEVATYKLLERAARRAGDAKVVEVAQRIGAEEREAAGHLAGRWHD
jgi:UDP-glucose 4-epimerase